MQKFNQRPTLTYTGGVVVGIGGSSERVKAILQIGGVAVGLFLEGCNISFQGCLLLTDGGGLLLGLLRGGKG